MIQKVQTTSKMSRSPKKITRKTEASTRKYTKPGYAREVSSAGGHSCINHQPYSCEYCNYNFNCADSLRDAPTDSNY